MIKVLGIDPGIERLGWALLESENKKFRYLSSGVKKTLKTDLQSKRLLEIHNFLDKLILEEQPNFLSLERLFFSKNVKTAMVVGEVRGVILMLASKHNMEIAEFGPNEIKLTLAGYGKADKKSVLNMVKMTVSIPDKKITDDESDALAIACCGVIHSNAFQTYRNQLFSKKD